LILLKVAHFKGLHPSINATRVGDEAPGLAEADNGIAVGSGSEIRAETAEIILVKKTALDG